MLAHYISLALVFLMSILGTFAQDLAPDFLSNVVYEKTPQSGLLAPTLSTLLGDDGLTYRIAVFQGPLIAGNPYRWRKTSANTGTLEVVSGSNVIQTFITFSSISGGSYQDSSGTGTIFITPFQAPAYAPLINISTRALLESGKPLIAGFIVSGNSAQRVLVRAIGPTLAQFGVSNAVPNPVLRLLKGDVTIASNSAWGGATILSSAFMAAGAFSLPSSSRDSAIVLNLDPGNYTAQITSDLAGEVLLEVYLVR
jgi:hypothetical protein